MAKKLALLSLVVGVGVGCLSGCAALKDAGDHLTHPPLNVVADLWDIAKWACGIAVSFAHSFLPWLGLLGL